MLHTIKTYSMILSKGIPKSQIQIPFLKLHRKYLLEHFHLVSAAGVPIRPVAFTKYHVCPCVPDVLGSPAPRYGFQRPWPVSGSTAALLAMLLLLWESAEEAAEVHQSLAWGRYIAMG